MWKNELINAYQAYCEKWPDAIRYTGRMKTQESREENVSIRCTIAQEANDIRIRGIVDTPRERRDAIDDLVNKAIAYDLSLDGAAPLHEREWVKRAFIAQFNY